MTAADLETMNLSVSAILHTIHHALMVKNYQGESRTNPSVIQSLAILLQERIRTAVLSAISVDAQSVVDWNGRVLEPVVASFALDESLDVSLADYEYIILLATVIVVGYEILLLPGALEDATITAFLATTFEQCLCEPKVHSRIAKRLMAEHRYLQHARARPSVQRAMHTLCSLMPDAITANAMWNSSDKNLQVRVQGATEDTACQTSNTDLERSMIHDLRIRVFLKPGCSWPFDFVDSVEENDGTVTIKTHIGLSMRLETGCIVSEISGIFDTVTVEALRSCKKAFIGTIIMPLGYCFRVSDVERVFETTNGSIETLVETTQAICRIANDGYAVKRRNCHRSVLIENTLG